MHYLYSSEKEVIRIDKNGEQITKTIFYLIKIC